MLIKYYFNLNKKGENMAMVFKSEKKLMEPISKNNEKPGPGEYLPQTIYKKIHTNKEPFLSTINGTFNKRDENFPGPGSYYQDHTLIKYIKNIQNEKISDNNNKKSALQSIKNNQNNLPKGENNKNNNIENLGFNIKAKRFEYKKELNEPGPGYYFPEINKYYKNKLIKIKEDEFNSKQKQKYNLYAQFNLGPTIPSKNQKFGFDILENGKIVAKKDPNLYKTFSGEKGDTVGPGTYEIEKKNELYKTRPHWTMSKEVRNCYITNYENLSKIESLRSTNQSDNSNNFNNNSNLLSTITANKFYVDEKLNVIELSPYNISNISISNYNYDINNNKSNNLNNINNKEKYKKISSRDVFKIKNNNPGPGFYIDRFKNSSFNIKSVPESKQFFGSKLERFHNINKSYDNNFGEDSHIVNDNKIIKSKSYLGFAPFSSMEKRFQIPLYLKEKYDMPSPSHYNYSKIKKLKSFSNFDKFGTSSKRFIEEKNVKWKKEIPGPGYYNPDKTRKHISTKKIMNSNKKNNNITNSNFYPLNYKINTIEYENNKKINLTNLKNVTFFRCNPNIKKSSSCKNLGPPPGHYYHDKKYEVKQIIPAFNKSKEKKTEFIQEPDNKAGPGQYNLDSYFDWNKKTFNISYA